VEKRVLIVVAHGDDETNGAGGTLMLLKEAGWDITIVYATLPVDTDAGNARREECLNAASLVGAKAVLWEYPDAKLEDILEARARMKEVYEAVQPTLVIGLHGLDVHPDHRAISAIALGPAMQRGVNIEYFTMELCSSGRHIAEDRPQSLGFHPTHYVDTGSVQKEVEAFVHCHAGQDPAAMYIGMGKMHQNRAAESGIGQVAEAFVRLTRVGELDPELLDIFQPSPFFLPRSIGIDFEPATIGL
jgi:LmbE family N-acetylglucosaminyl deacetylase